MTKYKILFISICCLLSCLMTSADAETKYNAKIFASNNTQIIDVTSAYKRLIGMPQLQLHNTMLNVIQGDHLEQGEFDNVLGTYQMLDEKKVTADNSQIFYTSPQQYLSNEDLFKLSAELAVALKQESVAVFIANKQSLIADVEVSFPAHPPTINKIINLINQQLPAKYHQAFSLYLDVKGPNVFSPKVTKIEWLGSKISLEEVKKVFSSKNIIFRTGLAFLVYKNGAVDQL